MNSDGFADGESSPSSAPSSDFFGNSDFFGTGDFSGTGDFFRAGGTLSATAPSYIVRSADHDLREALLNREYVYVLDSRQKGKSSLIVRAVVQLRSAGVVPVRLDLQRFGTNLSSAQWYASLLHAMGEELGLADELLAFWRDHAELGPCFRCFAAIEHVVLPGRQDPLVVFIDEIDFVRALPFGTDELFASIRDFYNRRSVDAKFQQITFCLVGVATPSQLIANEDVTPFNIGRRIELDDFSEADLIAFSREFDRKCGKGQAVVARIHHWVAGHPYLTQCLAREAWNAELGDVRGVDTLVRKQFLTPEGRQRQPNLADTERRLLEAQLPGVSLDESRSQVLEAYRALLRGTFRSASYDASLVATLRLSGVAVERGSDLVIRNRLYRTVFDERWRRQNLPDAEFRRQRHASRRAALRVGAISAAVGALLLAGLIWSLGLLDARNAAVREADRLSQINAQAAYRTSLALASEYLADGQFLQARDLIRSQAFSPHRGWEWDYLRAQIAEGEIVRRGTYAHDEANPYTPLLIWIDHGVRMELRGTKMLADDREVHEFPSLAAAREAREWLLATADGDPLDKRIAFAKRHFTNPDDNRLQANSADFTWLAEGRRGVVGIRLTNRRTGEQRVLPTLGPLASVKLSRRGRNLGYVAGSLYQTYDTKTRAWHSANSAASWDERYMIDFNLDWVRLRDLHAGTWRDLRPYLGTTLNCATFDRQGERLAVLCHDGSARVLNLKRFQLERIFVSPVASPADVAFHPDGRSFYGLYRDGTVARFRLDAATSPTNPLDLGQGDLMQVNFSPDGETLAATTESGHAMMVPTRGKQLEMDEVVGPVIRAHPSAFVNGGKQWLVVRPDGGVAVFDARAFRLRETWKKPGFTALSVVPGADGRAYIGSREGGLAVFDGRGWQLMPAIQFGFAAEMLAISPDGGRVVAATQSGDCRELNFPQGTEFARFPHFAHRITSLRFSSDGRWLARTTGAATAQLYDQQQPTRPPRELRGHAARVWLSRFDRSGQRLLTNGADGTARVWDVASGRMLSVMRHAFWVLAAEWSPDDRRVATACSDGFVRIFDPTDGFELAKLRGHVGTVLDVQFSPDGRLLASAGADGTLRRWAAYPIAR